MLEVAPSLEIPVCKALEKQSHGKYRCSAGFAVPLGCIKAYSPTDNSFIFCSVKFEKLKEEKAEE